ncbi:MAG: HAD family hydrolase [Planctomycetaceae bacterium]
MPPPPPIKAVVFDLDGLMFNTEDIFELTGRELLRRRALEFTGELRTKMMGRRAIEAYEILVETTGVQETAEALLAESQTIFDALLAEHLSPMPGLFDLLDCIEQQRLPKVVATSSSRGYLEGMLERFELSHRFPMTLAAEDVSHGKPHPEIYLTAAERMQVRPDEMLVFEDSETGTRAATAANAVVVSVPHRHSRDHSFEGAACVARGLNDPQVLRLIAGGNPQVGL